MTNPAATMRLLITYAICIPVAIVVGYILTSAANSPDYGTLGALGLVVVLLLAPVLIKWHYPIMVFGLGFPMTLFFIKGSPPFVDLIVCLSLGIAIVERTVNREHRFLRAPSITWPLLFTLGMILITIRLTGGLGLHSFGSEVGGGKKYISLFVGIAIFFALISRGIPKEQRNLYIGLFILSALPSFLHDFAFVMPKPLNYLGLLFPPSGRAKDGEVDLGVTRLVGLAASAEAIASFMLAKFGMRGIFTGGRTWWRAPFFLLMLVFTLLGGFRTTVAVFAMVCCFMFFMEGLHRTRLLPTFAFVGIIGVGLLVPFADKLPYTCQRALSFLPLDVSSAAKADAEYSSEWRYRIWAAVWPQVPQYLLLGKGYALDTTDMEMIQGSLANTAESRMDASQQALALAGNYHNGPLSVLMPFGIWGAITFLWLTLAGLRVMYRNFKYGDQELRIINTYLLALYLESYIHFFLIFGAYENDLAKFAKLVGFSIALNWGICGLKARTRPAFASQTKPLREIRPQPSSA